MLNQPQHTCRRWISHLAVVCTATLACVSDTGLSQTASSADAIQTSFAVTADGRTLATIIIPANPTAYETKAADELAYWLGKVTGSRFEVLTEAAADRNAACISVGATALFARQFPAIDVAALATDAIVIQSRADGLFLNGQGTRGTLYAVYTFLEDVCGVRWWTPTEHSIPHIPDLIIPCGSTVYEPPFSYREGFYRDMVEQNNYSRPIPPTPDEERFAVIMKNNGHNTVGRAEWGGKTKIIGWAHTMPHLVPLSKWGDRHPEWFSTNKAWEAQLCLTNPEAVAELIRSARRWIGEYPDETVFSISQTDSLSYCQCDRCREAVAEDGSPSGPLLRAVNQVAEALEKDRPGIVIETLAYQYSQTPPKLTRPRANVLVRICTADCSFNEPLANSRSPANVRFVQDMTTWGKIATSLHVWDYSANFSNLNIPHPNLFALGPNIQTYARAGVTGVFCQGNAYSPVGDMTELKQYVIMHMLWNPLRDPDALIAEFLRGYYGPAADSILAYRRLLEARAAHYVEAGDRLSFGHSGEYLDLETMNAAAKLLAAAFDSVKGDAQLERRVARVLLPLDHMWLLGFERLRGEAAEKGMAFLGPEDFRSGITKFREAAAQLGATHFAEGSIYPGNFNSIAARLDRWEALHRPPQVRLPAGYAQSPNAPVLELQEDRLRLFDHAAMVEDQRSGNGKAARMNGSDSGWSIQSPSLQEFGLQGRWRCLAEVRAEVVNAEGSGLLFAAYRHGEQNIAEVVIPAADLADGAYRLLDLGEVELGSKPVYAYFVGGPTSGLQSIVVDRVFLIRESN